MNLKGRYLARLLSTNRGSAGMEFILWTFLLLIFILIPVFSFVFEKFMYGVQANRWSAALDNSLDSMEWHLQTEGLARTERDLSISQLTLTLSQSLNALQEQNRDSQWQILDCQFESDASGGHPRILVKVQVRYPAATFIGRALSSDGKMNLVFDRLRELPYDR